MAKAVTDKPNGDGDLESLQGAIVDKNAAFMQSFIDWLAERAETTDEDQFAIMASILGEIMQAENVAEALAEQQALKARDILETPLVLHGFEIRSGDYEESMVGFYAALTVSRVGSEVTRIVTCGGTKVLGRLWKLDQLGEWPVFIKFTEKKTGKGYGVLDIVSPTQSVVLDTK